MKERNARMSAERRVSRDWLPVGKSQKQQKQERKVERKGKINQTSEQNAMVDLVSPGIRTEGRKSRACADCNRSVL